MIQATVFYNYDGLWCYSCGCHIKDVEAMIVIENTMPKSRLVLCPDCKFEMDSQIDRQVKKAA